MNSIRFIVPGPVRGKGRPRFVRATGHAYTDEATETYENQVKSESARAMQGSTPFEGSIALVIRITIAPPASTSAKQRVLMLAQRVDPTKKPDLDNIVKLAMDAMNGIVWTDDKNVVRIAADKRYGEASNLEILVTEI